MKTMKRFNLFFAILLIFSSLSFMDPIISTAASLENAVTITAIDEDGNQVLPLSAISIEEGDTALNVLEAAGKKTGTELSFDEHPEFGAFIVSIGEAIEKDNHYWAFIVNGVSADVGASSYDVSNGDNILLSLTSEFSPTVDVTVSAVNGDLVVIPETVVNIMAGSTGYDALYQAALKNDSQLEATIDDTYFTFINNIGGVNLGETGFWNISVNHTDLATGILEHHVVSGDQISLMVKSFDDFEEEPDDNVDSDSSVDPEEDMSEQDTPIVNGSVEQQIQQIKDYIAAKKISISYGSEWWVWGLANTDGEVPPHYLQSVKDKVVKDDGDFRNIFDLEKIIIALSLIGEDATHIEGFDLIELLADHGQLKNPMINAAIYGLLAFDSGNYDVTETVKQPLINTILAEEIESGGWAFFGDIPSADITGMALAALAPYRDQANVQAAIDRAVNYLSSGQDDNGGYYEKMNGGYTAEAVAQVIIGLSAIDIDPTSKTFTKEGTDLVQHLLLYQMNDNGYGHVLADQESSIMATQQALLAFAAYDNLLHDRGSVYQFNQQMEVPKEPIVPEEPSEPEEPEQPQQPVLPEEPSELETDEKPSIEVGLVDDGSNLDQNEDSDLTGEVPNNKLPKTATHTFNLLLIGFILLSSGLVTLLIIRKKCIN